MSSALLDDLMADFTRPIDSRAAPTPAKAANPANRAPLPGGGPDTAVCEGLRNAANSLTSDAPSAADSQKFAAVRNAVEVPHTGLGGANSQFSQDSQGLPGSMRIGADLSTVAWTDADITVFLDRRARLLRWGWPEPEAEALAERLVLRDRDRADDRISCTDCRHYRPGHCRNHQAADLTTADVARNFAALLQRCPAFASTKTTTNSIDLSNPTNQRN